MVDKTLRYAWLCVCYVEVWYAPICLVTLSSAYWGLGSCDNAIGNVTRQIGAYKLVLEDRRIDFG
jgi:hypothetical protein